MSQDYSDIMQKFQDLMQSLDIKPAAAPANAHSISPNYNTNGASLRNKHFKRKQLPVLNNTNGHEQDYDSDYSIATPLSSEQGDRNDDDYLLRYRKSSTAKAGAHTDYFAHYSQEYIDFTYENPTTYHVVHYVSQLLESYGFKYLSEKSSWGGAGELKSGLYYTTRNGTSLSAFAIGDSWKPEFGVGLVGAHIDALTAKLKPSSLKKDVDGFQLLGVAPYAGALSELWWDRDLHIGGRVLVREDSGKVVSKLVRSETPIARIPSLAPHFGKNFADYLNKETRAVPVISFSSPDDEQSAAVALATEEEAKSPLVGVHSIDLLRYVAELAQVKVQDLVQLDLDLYDGQKGTIGGIKKDFLFAPRIDDRILGFASVYGLLESLEKNDFHIPSDAFSVVSLYDNEEIGSLSKQGAQGGLSESVIERTIDSYLSSSAKQNQSLESLFKIAYANTLILSADVTHAFNPNFGEFYLDQHKPLFNTGPAIAFDERAMATDIVGRSIVEKVASLNGDKLQKFHIRNDSRSGGTIGPYISSKTGARTVDLGIGQWSMHSIRATVGLKDVGLGVKFFSGFFKYWRQVADEFGDL